MKAFKGAQRVPWPVPNPACSPRDRLAQGMAIIDHPERFRNRIRLILEITRPRKIFRGIKVEWYDLGQFDVALSNNTMEDYRAVFHFPPIEAKVKGTAITLYSFVDGRITGKHCFSQPILVGDIFNLSYIVRGGTCTFSLQQSPSSPSSGA